MHPHEDQPFEHYDIGSSTSSKYTKQVPLAKEVEEEEKEKYSSGKPKRITIRARIIHSVDQENKMPTQTIP
jgi:hypothetical protein